MGGIIAKINSDNNLTNIKSEIKISDKDKKKLIDYYNQHGLLNISLSTEKLKKVMNNYISNLSLLDNKFIDKSFKKYMEQINILILISSNSGLLMIDSSTNSSTNTPKNKNNVESFDNYECFEEVNYGLNENFSSSENSEQEQPSSPEKSEPESPSSPEKSEPESPSSPEKSEPESPSSPEKSEPESPSSPEKSEPKSPSNNDDMPKEIKIIIPKILLTSDRKEFIDFISNILKFDKMIYKLVNNLLERISKEPNNNVKIFNLINLVIRVSLIVGIFFHTKKLGPNVFSKDNENKFISMVLVDILSVLPSDKCIFDNDQNIIQFNPDVCKIKKNVCKECPKCDNPELELFTESECPVCDNTKCDCSKCPNEENNTNKIITIILATVAIILILLYFMKCSKLKNLTRLN